MSELEMARVSEMPHNVAARSRPFRSDVFLTFGSRAIMGLAAFVASVIASRELGPSGRGLMAVALTLSATLLQVGHLGLVSANTYFAARNPTLVSRIIANSLAWALTLGSALIGALVVTKIVVPALIAGLGWAETLIAVVVLPSALAAVLLQAVLLGEGRTGASTVPQAVLSIATVAALVIVTASTELTVAVAVALMVAQWAVAAPVYYLLAGRLRIKSLLPDVTLARLMITYALRVYAATVLSFLVIRFDLFLVNAYLGSEEVGLYSVAAIVAEAMFILPVAIGMNIFFRVAHGGEAQLTASVFRAMLVVYGVSTLALGAAAKPVVPLLFGEAFVGSVALLYWLLPGIFSLGMLTILSYHFAGRGYPRQATLHWAVGLGVNVALNVALLNDLGTYVAALASSIAYTVILLLHVRLFAREVGWHALRPRLGDVLGLARTPLGRERA